MHAEVDLTHLKTMMVLLWAQKVILRHTGSSILIMTVASSLTLTAMQAGGTMMRAQQTLVTGGSMMSQEITGGHKMNLTAQSRSTMGTHHLNNSTVNIIVDMVNWWPGGGTTIHRLAVLGSV